MGRNVIARQSGDDYQAKFFWLKACELYHAPTNVVKVAWEMDATFGFDDVVVYYEPAILESGSEVKEAYYQVKFHVDHAKGFTYAALIDPQFIGAKNESLLQRLHKIYKQNPSSFNSARFYIVNTWGLDHSDDLRFLLGNTGGIRLEKLFEGGDNSIFGKIRILWKEHLKITCDEELRRLLAPLRIKHSFDDEQRLQENLNLALAVAGLKPIPFDQRSSKYVDLIQKLHKEERNTFTKEELFEICRQEDLLHEKPEVNKDEWIIGIRSFQKGAENLHLEVQHILCLLHYFSGRFIMEEYSWTDQISPQIEELADKAIAAKKPLIIHLDTHLSIALYLGYCLNIKYGVDVGVVQKTNAGRLFWKPEPAIANAIINPLWSFTEKSFLENGVDIALAVSVTHDICFNVEDYLQAELPQVCKCFNASILPKPGFVSIQDANHVIAAVQELIATLRNNMRDVSKEAKIHLFLAAPNAFAFFLGQQLKPLGKVVLYEFDFDNPLQAAYHPVISLP